MIYFELPYLNEDGAEGPSCTSWSSSTSLATKPVFSKAKIKLEKISTPSHAVLHRWMWLSSIEGHPETHGPLHGIRKARKNRKTTVAAQKLVGPPQQQEDDRKDATELDFAEMTRPHLLVVFQHGEILRSIRLVLNIREVYHVGPILWRFGFLLLAIDYTVIGEGKVLWWMWRVLSSFCWRSGGPRSGGFGRREGRDGYLSTESA